jgi:hydroxypyruvate reductase
VLTLAVSDVVGDDLSMIASGPTVADPTTFASALDVLDAHGGRASFPAAVVAHLEDGAAGRG